MVGKPARLGLAVGLVIAGGPAVSAPAVPFAPDTTEACLRDAAPDGRMGCVGQSAAACMNTDGDWQTTVGTGNCLNAEFTYWDGRLNTAYSTVMATAEAADAEAQTYGWAVPSQVIALRDMQRAWIGYRDRTCDWERSLWGGGTGGGPAAIDCMMRLTARQTLYLEDMQVWGN